MRDYTHKWQYVCFTILFISYSGVSSPADDSARVKKNSTDPIIGADSTTYYFPLEVGDYRQFQFRYMGYFFPELGDTAFVFDTVLIGGKKYYRYGETLQYGKYYRIDSTGNVFIYSFDDTTETLLYDFTLAVGDSYMFSDGLGDWVVKVISRNDSVTVPIGHFDDCIELFFDVPEVYDEEYSLWFAPGVGVVKREMLMWGIWELYTAYVGGVIYPPIIGAIEDDRVLVSEYTLDQNYPNPFNPVTTIKYSLPGPAEVLLIVYNLGGEEVERLVDDRKPTGNHQVTWDASNMASGIYLYRLKAGEYIETKKMVVLK